MLGFCALSEAPISDLGDKSVYAAAQISAYAEASAFASVFYDVSGNIVCYADVAAYPNEIYWAYANVNGTAEVSALAQNISSAIAYIDGNATVSAYANSIFLFTADINAEADVTANGYRIQFADAYISGFADLTVLSNVVYSDSAFVECNAYVTGLANATYSGYGFINANASIVAKGVIVGEGWTFVVPGAEVWSDITPSSDVWTALTPSTDYWLNITTPNLDNGGDYKASGLEEYPEIYNISVDAKTTALVMNGTNGGTIYNTSSSGMAGWGSDNASFTPISYIQNQDNGSINPDFIWASYYKNDTARSNDIVYANEQFNGNAYWISLINVLIGKSAPPLLSDYNNNTTTSNIYAQTTEYNSYNLNGIAYKNSQIIAVGWKQNNITDSIKSYTLESNDNANTWLEVETISNNNYQQYNSIASSNLEYSIVGTEYDNIDRNDPYGIYVYSSDGTNFTQANTGSYIINSNKVIYGNNEFIAIDEYGKISKSTDGTNWSLSVNLSYTILDIIWDGSQYIILSNDGVNPELLLSTSYDAVTWSSFNVIASFSGNCSMVYNGSKYTIICNHLDSSPNPDWIITSLISTDLITWTNHTVILSALLNNNNSLVYNDGQYVLIGIAPGVGFKGLIMTSPDAINWTQQAINQFELTLFNKIIWDSNKYIIVGSLPIFTSSLIITSSDGITWTKNNISLPSASLKNVSSGSSVIVPANGLVILCSNVSLYYPDRDLYTSSGLTEAQIDIVMDAAVSPLNITNITDTSNLTWIKRSYIYIPYDTDGELYPAMAQEIWYAINNTSVAVTSNPTITYENVFDSQTISLTSWSGVNLDSPFQNLIPTTNIWTETNPGTDTWLRQG